MPQYISPLGVSCTADEAKPGGRIRPGYKELVGPGDYVSFDIMMQDQAAASRSTFFTDSQSREVNDRAARDAVRAMHNGDYSDANIAVLRQNEEAAYQRSKTSVNDWRNDRDAAVAAAVRDSRYL